MSRGTVFQRHTRKCPRAEDGSYLSHKCHGKWTFHLSAGSARDGTRKQFTKGGFATKADALAALRELVMREDAGLGEAYRMTVGEYLEEWLSGKRSLRETTRRSYRSHIDRYLRPNIGHLKLVDLRPHHVEAMYRSISDAAPERRVTLLRVHATLRSALNLAVKRRLIPWNPSLHVELPRAHAHTITVWTPEQVAVFLSASKTDRLYALYHLVAFTGLRRGEVAGLRWKDLDLDRGLLRVAQQLQLLGGELSFVPPKTRSGLRTVTLDQGTVLVLKQHLRRQQEERLVWAEAYREHDLVFAWEDGAPLTPDHIFRRFQRLAAAAKLPRIRLHDLRHTSASLALAAGVPMKVVSDRLGHSSTTITADLYTHVVPAVARDAAEAIAGIVPKQDQEAIASALLAQSPPPKLRRGASTRKHAGHRGAPPGTRTPDPLIKSQLL